MVIPTGHGWFQTCDPLPATLPTHVWTEQSLNPANLRPHWIPEHDRIPYKQNKTPARIHSCLQFVARIETQLRLRDGWMAEIEAVRSNELLDQAAARPKFQQPVHQDAGPGL